MNAIQIWKWSKVLELIRIREYMLNLIPPLFASAHLSLFMGRNVVRAMQCSVGAIIYNSRFKPTEKRVNLVVSNRYVLKRFQAVFITWQSYLVIKILYIYIII